MMNTNKAGMQTLQPVGQPLDAGLVQASLITGGVSGVISAAVPVASTAAIAVSIEDQVPAQPGQSIGFLDGGEVFLLIGFALIGMVAIVRRQGI